MFFYWQPAFAQQDTDSAQKEVAQLEGVVELLESEEQTEDLLKKLKSLLEARKKLLTSSPKPESKPEEKIDLVMVYRRYSAMLSSKTGDFVERLTKVTSDYQKLKRNLIDQTDYHQLVNLGIKLILAGGIGILLFLLLRRSIKRWSPPLDVDQGAGWGRKWRAAGLRFLLGLYPVVIIVFAAWIFLRLAFPGKIKMFVLILLAWATYRIVSLLIFHVFSPEETSRRLIPFSDETANYIYIWSRRILLFSLWFYLLIISSSAYNLKTLAFVFATLYKIGLILIVTLIMAQWKETLFTKFTIEHKADDNLFVYQLKVLLNFLTKNLYLAVVLYLSFIVILSLLGFEKLYRYFLYSSVKTLLALVVAYGLWCLWDILFQRLFQVGDNIRQQMPHLEKQVNRYVSVIDKAGHLFVLLLAFLWVLEAWQIDVFGFLSDHSEYFLKIVRIPVILVVAIVFVQIGNVLIKKFEQKLIHRQVKNKEEKTVSEAEIEKRVTTVGNLMYKAILATIWIIAILMIVRELGFDIGPALAGAGIFGIALGFGTQNLVKDIINGLFMIAENQIRVGDVAILNGTGGLVESINLRTTVLRSLDGVVHVFPNGNINSLSNMTREFSFYIFDIGVAYKEDVDRVVEILKQIGEEIMQDENFKPFILEPLEILGLDKFADSAIIIKARIKTMPIKQWMIGREMNRRIKKRFDELDIEIPFPHRTFYFGEVSNPVKIKME
jgi:small conductance mechanosensitive channel